MNYWDNYRFEPPEDIPNYNILWRGSIWIPKDGEYTFKVNTNGNNVFLFIDAQSVLKYRTGGDAEAQIHLQKGWKPIQINYFNQAKFATLNLRWQKPGDSKTTNISSRYLIPFEKIESLEILKYGMQLDLLLHPCLFALVSFSYLGM